MKFWLMGEEPSHPSPPIPPVVKTLLSKRGQEFLVKEISFHSKALSANTESL